MTCEEFSADVAKAIRNVPGATDVEVNFELGKAVVTTSTAVPAEQILAAIETSGFQGLASENSDKDSAIARESEWSTRILHSNVSEESDMLKNGFCQMV